MSKPRILLMFKNFAFACLTSYRAFHLLRIVELFSSKMSEVFKLKSTKFFFIIGVLLTIVTSGFAVFNYRRKNDRFKTSFTTLIYGNLMQLIMIIWRHHVVTEISRKLHQLPGGRLRFSYKPLLLRQARWGHRLSASEQNHSVDLHKWRKPHPAGHLLFPCRHNNRILNAAHFQLHLDIDDCRLRRDEKDDGESEHGCEPANVSIGWIRWHSLQQF